MRNTPENVYSDIWSLESASLPASAQVSWLAVGAIIAFLVLLIARVITGAWDKFGRAEYETVIALAVAAVAVAGCAWGLRRMR